MKYVDIFSLCSFHPKVHPKGVERASAMMSALVRDRQTQLEILRIDHRAQARTTSRASALNTLGGGPLGVDPWGVDPWGWNGSEVKCQKQSIKRMICGGGSRGREVGQNGGCEGGCGLRCGADCGGEKVKMHHERVVVRLVRPKHFEKQ